MKTKRIILSVFLMGALGYGCQEEVSDDSPAPAPITVREVVNTSGGAIIRYTLPNDKNLLGVKAVYERNGETVETKASLYVDELSVEGFGDTNPHEVTLYSVGRNEKLSSPTPVQITPETPSVLAAQVQLDATWGGIKLTFKNPAQANLSFVVMVDSTGTWEPEPVQTFYAGADSGFFTARNVAFKEHKYGVYVRDRWLNQSAIVSERLIPLEEIEIPKDVWTNGMLPGDSYDPAEGNYNIFRIEHLWDGQIGYLHEFATTATTPMPQHFTIDLGRSVAISRFALVPRQNYENYAGLCPRIFELYGSDNPPANGSFDNWHLLGRWEYFKPSGYGSGRDVGPITQEDLDYAISGGSFDLEPNALTPEPWPTVTHIRFRTLSTFDTYLTPLTQGYICIDELTLYGQLRDN
ncbi:hypothetical protein AGMMS49982_06550 [Bacteroidia bacterium]|nr:hypothetical protein AGMMS49982_06550 [Bacteroidia bacterium]